MDLNTQKQNYQRQMEEIIASACVAVRPRLLLHACCAPCSSYVLELLSPHFDITLYFYNPNISTAEEYALRAAELRRLVEEMGLSERVSLIVPPYDPAPFEHLSSGREEIPEGGARCFDCYRLRLHASALVAAEGGYDFYCTTLSISPHKNAARLNEIGMEEGALAGVRWLPSDFKKQNGYKRSCELSRQYSLYRQDFCGCVHSQREALRRASLLRGES